MRIALLTERGFIFKEVKRPDCKPGQVLLRATSLGVCTGDVEKFQHVAGGPAVELQLGHEGTGVVAAVGRGVHHFQEGDIVTSLHGPYAEYFVTTPEMLV